MKKLQSFNAMLWVCILFAQDSHAQDHTRMGLPEGAIARIEGWPLAYSPDGTRLAVASGLGIWLYDAVTLTKVDLLSLDTGGVVAFSPDWSTLARSRGYIYGAFERIWIWDLASGQEATLTGMDIVDCLAFSPDGSTLASGGWSAQLWLWDLASSERKASLGGHEVTVLCLAFSPDGSTLASGGEVYGGAGLRLWDFPSGQLKAKLPGHEVCVSSVGFSPDGQMLASGGCDGKVRLWDAGSGQLKAILPGGGGVVYSVAFSPDGSVLASGSGEYIGDDYGTVLLWDAGSGQVLATLEFEYLVGTVMFSPDGTTLIGGGFLWDMSYVTSIRADESDSPSLPAKTALQANYPNPFNSRTQIAYRLAAPGPVRLEIYNVLGQRVRTLVNEFQPAGMYQTPWDARDQQGATVGTGVYLTRLIYSGGVQTRRMLYLE